MRIAPLSMIGAAGLWLVASCGGEDLPTDRTPFEAGTLQFDSASTDDGGGGSSTAGCPDSPPKVGESCGPGVSESTSCEFVSGLCTANNMEFTESTTYCCLVGVWEACGSRSPCDAFDAALPPPPPGDVGPSEVSVVTPDGGVDAGPEAGASDAATD